MEEYEEVNQHLEEMELLDQILLVVTFIAGRDMLLRPAPAKLKEAVESFKNEVFDSILEELNLVELFLCRKELKKFIMRRCNLRVDAYNRVKLYYNGEAINTLKVDYQQKDLDKSELENFFKNAIKTGRDVCMEIQSPEGDFTEFVVTKNEDLKEKLKYYLKNFDDNLCLKENKKVKIIEIILFNFVI